MVRLADFLIVTPKKNAEYRVAETALTGARTVFAEIAVTAAPTVLAVTSGETAVTAAPTETEVPGVARKRNRKKK